MELLFSAFVQCKCVLCDFKFNCALCFLVKQTAHTLSISATYYQKKFFPSAKDTCFGNSGH